MKAGNSRQPRSPQRVLVAERERLGFGLQPNMNSNRMLKLGVAWALLALFCGPMQAKLAWNKKSKQHDAGVTGCISCHEKEKPKKGDPLAERGQWLVDEKAKRGAKDIDLSWLKDYPKNGK